MVENKRFMKEIPPLIGIQFGQSNSAVTLQIFIQECIPILEMHCFFQCLVLGACGGGQSNGNWGVLSGIYTPDSNHYGCYQAKPAMFRMCPQRIPPVESTIGHLMDLFLIR